MAIVAAGGAVAMYEAYDPKPKLRAVALLCRGSWLMNPVNTLLLNASCLTTIGEEKSRD
jgi:hypothetical protein